MEVGKSSYFDLNANKTEFQVRVNWSENYDPSTNSSVVTVDSVQFKSTGWYGFIYYPDGLVKVNGETVITMDSNPGTHNCRVPSIDTWASIKKRDGEVATGSTTVVHDADGSKTITIELVGNNNERFYFFTAGTFEEQQGGAPWYVLGSSDVELTTIPTYTLSVSAGTGSTIAVNRTSSGYSGAGTGSISAGTRLYYGDKLKITFAPKTNYRLLTTEVNNVSFTSGNTHTVASNVSISSTAQVLASSVGATDANIGSTSTIVVTKYNTNYYHSLQYSFGNLSGYITSSGGVQSTEAKFKNTSVAFSVPTSFYHQIPNAQSGVCTITCRTYETSSSTAVLGSATTCTFTATAHKNNCAPIVTAIIEDTNSVTCVLTGNINTLVKHRSTARCRITAVERWGATIKSLSIAGKSVTGEISTDGQTGTAIFTNVDQTSFDFSATDSRGYTTTTTVRPEVIQYVVLTCNPKVARPTPTGTSMSIQASGNFFRGSFGAYSNTLKLQYRYRERGGSYGPWKTIDSANITIGASGYSTNGAVILDDEFDYQKSYDFQIQATDGIDGYTLTTAQQTVTVQRGVPVFDWGENDFNVNGDLRISNVSLLEIIYPIGSVYMSVESRLPQALTSNGMSWDPLPNVGNMYCWVRAETLSPPIQA